jgi:hypothetical protein
MSRREIKARTRVLVGVAQSLMLFCGQDRKGRGKLWALASWQYEPHHCSQPHPKTKLFDWVWTTTGDVRGRRA